MKTLLLRSVLLAAAFVMLLAGCKSGDEFAGNPDTGYEGFKSDAELFYEFVYKKESIALNALNYTSDGFSKAPFSGNITKENFEKFFLEIEDFNKNSDKYLLAAQRLEQSGVLQKPTHTKGLFSSVMDYIGWGGGVGKRFRNRILTVSSNLKPHERTILYKNLSKEWKDKTSSEADFWSKVEKGYFDNSTTRIYNEFYNYGEETEFADLAIDKGLTIHKIVVEEGARGIEVGANLAIDAASEIIPGFGTGVTIVTVSDNVEKMAKSKSWKEAAEHGYDAVANTLGEFGELPSKIGDVMSAVKELHEKSKFKKGGNSETKGKVTVKDHSTKEPATIIIAQKKGGESTKDGSPSIYVIAKKSLTKNTDMLIKAGTWLVTALSKTGLRETVEVQVDAGKETVAEVNTEEPKEEKGGKSKYSSFYLDIGMVAEITVRMNPSQVFTSPGSASGHAHLSTEGPIKFTKISGSEYMYEHTYKHTYEGMEPGYIDNTKFRVKIFIDNNNYAKLEYYHKREMKSQNNELEDIFEVKCSQIPFKEKKGDRFIYSLTDIPASKVDYFFAEFKNPTKQNRVETYELVDNIGVNTNNISIVLYE